MPKKKHHINLDYKQSFIDINKIDPFLTPFFSILSIQLRHMHHDFFKTGHGIYNGVVCPD